MITRVPFHPVADIFPMMDESEYAGLVADIKANGLREPIWLHSGKIIDGRNRYRACCDLNIEPTFRTWDGEGSLVAFVVSLNLHRRHLTASQRAIVALDVEKLQAEEAKERQRAAGGDRKSENARKAMASIPKQLTPGQRAAVAVAVVEELSKEGEEKSLPAIVPEAISSAKNRSNESREQAAKLVGVGARYVSDAKKIQQQAPELLEKVKAGELTLPQARLEVKRQEKRKELEEKAKAAEEVISNTPSPWEIRIGDCVEVMEEIEAGTARLVFADPPYNIGIDYGEGEDADRMPPEEFASWVARWVRECNRILTPDGSLWVLISDEYAAECCIEMRRAGFTIRNWVKWYEGFGVNCTGKFNRCTRHLFHATKDSSTGVFHADAVSRPSDRQTKYNDARANPAGKILDDCWFDIPRLAGSHNERMPDFPTQLPVALLLRVISCASDPGDLVVDPFNGSGTTGAACIQLQRRYLGIEKNPRFAELATTRLKGWVK